MSKIVKITRRQVVQAGAAVAACCSVPGVAFAQRRGAEPTGQTGDIIEVEGGTSYDLSAVGDGEMVAFKNGDDFIGVVRRTAAQKTAAADNNVSLDLTTDGERVQNADYLVVDMTCQHRGCQVGYTGEAEAMFQCPCHRTSFDASGRVLPQQAKTDESLGVPSYTLSGAMISFG